jgi:hypothetical protein
MSLFQEPSNTISGGCAAGENELDPGFRRDDAPRGRMQSADAKRCAFPPYGVRQRFCANTLTGRRSAPQENHHEANDATECDGPAALPEKIANRYSEPV